LESNEVYDRDPARKERLQTHTMDQSTNLNRPRKITFCSSSLSRERLATEIGILNSPYPPAVDLPGIDGNTNEHGVKRGLQLPIVANYEPPAPMQQCGYLPGNGVQLPAVKCIVDQRETNRGLEFKVSWEETWLSELELAELVRTFTKREKTR
jgi:hypothetical protein